MRIINDLDFEQSLPFLHCRNGGENDNNCKKWGNSLAIRIPKVIAEELLFKNNVKVELHTDKGSLLVKSVEIEYSLDSLLAKVTDENLHEETSTVWVWH